MKKEEVNKILDDMLGNINSGEYDGEYDSSELQYMKKNINNIKKALMDGTLKPENLTEDIVYSFINDGLDLSIIAQTSDVITPNDAVKAALQSPPTAEQIQTVEKQAEIAEKEFGGPNIE